MIDIEEFKRMDMEARLKATVCSVEATNFEQLCLWKKWSDANIPACARGVKWEELLDGWGPTVGQVNGNPVCVSLRWCLINDKPVLFWQAISKVVDYDMVEEWLKKMMPQVYRNQPSRTTDGMNFHVIVHTIEMLAKADQLASSSLFQSL